MMVMAGIEPLTSDNWDTSKDDRVVPVIVDPKTIANLWGVYAANEDNVWTYRQLFTRAGDISISGGNSANNAKVPLAAVIDRVNTISTPRNNAWWFVVAGAACAIPVHLMHRPLFAALLLMLCLFLAYRADLYVRNRGTFTIEYRRTPSVKVRWDSLNATMAVLARSKEIWTEVAEDDSALAVAARQLITLEKKAPKRVVPSLVPYHLSIDGQDLFFLPDNLYTVVNGMVSAINYSEIEVHWTQKSSIARTEEDPGNPDDYRNIVDIGGGPSRNDQTIDGSPTNYGVIRMAVEFGLDVTVYVTKPDTARLFAEYFEQFVAGQAIVPQIRSSVPRSQVSQKPQADGAPVPAIYATLGLIPGCTRDEAALRYRKLLEAYHPDRIDKIAPQYKDAANKQLAVINKAYQDLRDQQGW